MSAADNNTAIPTLYNVERNFSVAFFNRIGLLEPHWSISRASKCIVALTKKYHGNFGLSIANYNCGVRFHATKVWSVHKLLADKINYRFPTVHDCIIDLSWIHLLRNILIWILYPLYYNLNLFLFPECAWAARRPSRRRVWGRRRCWGSSLSRRPCCPTCCPRPRVRTTFTWTTWPGRASYSTHSPGLQVRFISIIKLVFIVTVSSKFSLLNPLPRHFIVLVLTNKTW